MSERRVELQQVLTDVRRRWTRRSRLGAWTLGAAVATVLLLAGWATVRLLATDGMPLVLTLGFVSVAALAGLARALWPLRHRPTDRQIARFVEERAGGLDDVVATAVAYAERPDATPRMRDVLAADAAAALSDVDLDAIVPRRAVWQALVGATAITAALAAVVALLLPSFSRAGRVASAYLFPAHIGIEVRPGTAKHRAGQPLTIAVRLPGSDGALVPTLTLGAGDQAKTVRMERDDEGGFAVTLENVKASFAYSVTARAPSRPITRLQSSARPASSASTCSSTTRRASAWRLGRKRTAATSTGRRAPGFASRSRPTSRSPGGTWHLPTARRSRWTASHRCSAAA